MYRVLYIPGGCLGCLPSIVNVFFLHQEIVTAFKNKVCTVPLICDDYEPLDELALEQIPDVWTAQQKQILAYHGITMEDVQTVSR